MKKDDYSIDKKVINRILTLPQLHILFIFLVYGGVNMLEPEVPGDNLINDLLDNTFIGSVVGLFTEVDTSPNYQLIELVDKVKQNVQFYVFIMAILILVESIGLIGRKVNRYVIECVSIICSISPLIALVQILDVVEYILAQSKMYGIFNFFGGAIDLSSYYRVFSVIIFIALPINHILSHKALSTYYAPIDNNNVSAKGKLYMAISIIGSLLFIWKILLNPKIDEGSNMNDANVDEIENVIVKEENDKKKNDFFNDVLAETNDTKSEKIDERLNIIKESKQIILVEDISVYYWDKENQSPYDLCFYKQNLNTGDTIKINIPTDLGLSSINDIFQRDDSTFLIIGNNGWNSYMNSDYAVSFNMNVNSFTKVLSSKTINKIDNYLEVSILDMITLGEFTYQNDYDIYVEHYDFYGNRIEGNTIRGKGTIGKYPIEMSFHCLKGDITGWYKYDGHTDYMTIKGTIHENNSFTFTEYNDAGEAFATFYGEADFEQQRLMGIWENGNDRLNFEIGNELVSDQTITYEDQIQLKENLLYWNVLHTNKIVSATSLECLYASDVFFYGQTLSSKECVDRIILTMKKYKTFSQIVIGKIQLSRLENGSVRCDFVKRVKTDEKYKDYPAYLVFRKEGNEWCIIAESDAQTDAYFEQINNQSK